MARWLPAAHPQTVKERSYRDVLAGGELQVTASIQQPAPASGLGYWPAFWMLGAGFRATGAITSGCMNCT